MEKLILEALEQINSKLDSQGQTLNEHGQLLKEHGQTLKEHSGILKSLISGQDFLKAELSELRLQNAKEFGELKERMGEIETSVDILKEENWNNKKDIRRIQNTMGLT